MGYMPSRIAHNPGIDNWGSIFFTDTMITATNVSAGDLLTMNASAMWIPTHAGSSGAMPCCGLAFETIQSGVSGYVALGIGVYRCATFPTLTPRLPIFANNSTGKITQSAPTGSGNKVQVVGWAIEAKIIWFNPCLILGEIT